MKQRMVGAIVLVALAVIFIPMLLEDKEPPVESVKLDKQIPREPSTDYRTDLIPTEEAAEEAAIDSINYVSLQTVLHECDFITLHVPLTDKTRNIIGPQAIAKLKDGARYHMISAALRAWRTRPLFGIGPGMHRNLWPHFAPSPDGDRTRGIWPPSNPGLCLLPLRAICPLCPLPEVFPLPEPRPRPTRIRR